MSNRATHIIRFSSAIYGAPKQRDNFRCVIVRIYATYIAVCVRAFKHFVCSFANMLTGMAGLRTVSRINYNKFNSIKNSFVGNVLTQLIERPLTNSCSKLFAFFKRRKANAFKVFNSNSFIFFFSNFNNLFGNRVVDNRGGCAFSATKPFQEFFTSSCAFTLNGTSYFLSFFSIILKFFRVKFFTITKRGNRHQPEIHPYKFFNILNIFFWNVNGLKKVKLSFLVNQIRFTFYVRQVVGIVANKRYFNSSTDSPQRNNVIWFVGHYPTIVSNASKCPKFSFNLFVKFVGIGNFCNTSYQHLTTKFKSGFIGVVNFVMEFKIIEDTLSPSHIRNGIANGISLLHCIEKQVNLFVSRQKFYFQREFHNANIQIIFLYQKIITNFVKQFNYGAAIPPIGSRADQWVSLPKVL